ncbi:thermonuclease family protein [Tsuneonella sp. HG249]
MRHRVAILAALCAIPATLQAQTIAGQAKGIDGDSLTVSGIEVRLFGIDAPEGKQTCERDGKEWPCGEAAAGKLRSMIEGQTVACRARGRDSYGRSVAVCHVGASELNRSMVATGWATAFREYASDYIADETRAKADRLGIWDSTFQLPGDYRHQEQDKALARQAPQRFASPVAQAPAVMGRCAIKGNRNRRGEWIYHLPGFPYYEATRAEEIFCSEAQAQAAGYRRAIVR